MLSPDVPEFIPRGCQTPDSTNAVNFEPKESTSQPQPPKPSTNTHKPPSNARSNPPFVPRSSPLRGERERTFGSWTPNDSWRRPREAFGNQRERQTHEIIRHESGNETRQGETQRGRGKPRPVAENLELHIKNKFTPTPRPSYSYTKILKGKQPPNSTSVPDTKSIKEQHFSLSSDSQWPTLGESLPLYKTPEKNNKSPEVEKRNDNPWVKKGNEGSPTMILVKNTWQEREQTADVSIRHRTTETSSPMKSKKYTANTRRERDTSERNADASVRPRTMETSSPIKSRKKTSNSWQERGTSEQNVDASVRPKSTEISSPTKRFINSSAWQEGSTAQQTADNSVRPKITEGNAKTSEISVNTKSASHTPQRKAETNPPHIDNSRPVSKSYNLPKDKSDKNDKEPSCQKSYARNTMNTEHKTIHGIQSWEEAGQVTKTNTTQEDSDLFQWQVIGERKNKVKKVKSKPEEEVESSPRVQGAVRGDGIKHGRVVPNKSTQSERTKENQETINKSKGAHPLSTQETQGAINKDTVVLKATQRERKKPRPTKVMSLANCSNDKKELRSNQKIPITTTPAAAAAAKPMSEEMLQRKLAFKLMKKEEKIKKKEMKARQALMQSKDSKVSFITTNFLEKTQMASRASVQPSSQMNFTFEEYPSLQMQRNITSKRDAPQTSSPSLPSHTDTHHQNQNSSPNLPSDTNDPETSSSFPITKDQNSNHKPAKTSLKVGVKADDLLSGLIPPHCDDNDGDDALEGYAITYRKALLSAKAKKKATKQNFRPTEPPTDSFVDIPPPKKQIRTKDPLRLNLQALAVKCRKNKRREAAYLEEKSSPAKRKDNREDDIPGKKTGTASLPKAAGVVAKRGKINAKKPKKKKISRVQRCKIEKQQRETLALQLLLAQANVRQQQQQQELLEASSPTTYSNESEESTEPKSAEEGDATNDPLNTATKPAQDETTPEKETETSTQARSVEGDDNRSDNTNEPLNTATKTEKDERGPDKDEDEGKQKPSQERSEGKTEDCDENKENERSMHTSPNVNSQVMKTPAEGDDDKPKTIWKIKGIQDLITENEASVPEESSNLVIKDKNTDEEGKASSQDEPKSSHSLTQLELLTDDPLIAKKASELIELIKAQKQRPIGPREYCHQVVTPEVNGVAKELISTLMTFQKRHYQRDPTKARIRKRYVCGLKETTKLMGKMSCVIMAPNIQQCEGPGSLDDAVEKLLNQAEKLKVPVVFALSTKEMKYLCRKSSRKVSCFGIINYQGSQDLFQRLMQLMPEAQKQYQQLVASGQCTLPKEGEDEEEEEEGEDEPPKKDLNAEILNRTKSLLMAP